MREMKNEILKYWQVVEKQKGEINNLKEKSMNVEAVDELKRWLIDKEERYEAEI